VYVLSLNHFNRALRYVSRGVILVIVALNYVLSSYLRITFQVVIKIASRTFIKDISI
jgi:hypothetical protein